MLRNTFCHLPGVGTVIERSLWKAGVTTWEAFLDQTPTSQRFGTRKSWLDRIEESINEYQSGNTSYFATHLPRNQTWRLFKDFRHACAYIDIETTGLGSFNDYITTITLYDGQSSQCYVQGINLEHFPIDIVRYKLIVTYNGTTFDLPFLERQFGLQLHQAHIDLRYVLASLGYRGGLKQCERCLGVERPGLQDVDGYTAVLLWQEYRRKQDGKALETLLAYNVQDTLNLESLMIKAYNCKVQETPFQLEHSIREVPTAQNPYRADPSLLDRMLRTVSWRMRFRR